MPSQEIQDLGNTILDTLKKSAKDTWDSWTVEEKKLVSDISVDAAKVTLGAISGGDIVQEKLHIDAQLANIRAIGAKNAADLLWKTVTSVLGIAAKVLLA